MNVLVIGGTVDARNIIERLIKYDVKITATVATEFGGTLLKKYKSINVREGRLRDDDMVELIGDIGTDCLIDASHPFAKNVSLDAVKACEKAGIPYLRYERPETNIDDDVGIIRVRDFEEAVDKLKSIEGKVLLAIGSNNLDVFTKLPEYKNRLFVRVLPDSRVLAKCEGIGFNAENIIAAKGPFSESMNIEVLKHCGASVMVTKDSGKAGGSIEKISAAKRLGILVIMIERPHVEYEFTIEHKFTADYMPHIEYKTNIEQISRADDESHVDCKSNVDCEPHADSESHADCRYRFYTEDKIIDFIKEMMKVRGER